MRFRDFWFLRWDLVLMADELNHTILGRYYLRWLCNWNERRIWARFADRPIPDECEDGDEQEQSAQV